LGEKKKRKRDTKSDTEKPHKTLSIYLLVLMLLLRVVASSFPSFHNNHARRIPLKKRLATLSASASSSSKMETTTKTIESDGTQTPLKIVQLPALSDNYVFLLHCANTKSTAVIDTPEVGPILRELKKRNWQLTHILNTHWHSDHTGGNLELKKEFPEVQIIGPRGEKAKTPGAEKIPGVDRKVEQDDVVFVGDVKLHVMDVPGHTLGHCAYYAPSANSAFVGDCVFAMGCGRVFEGTHPQMFASITKIMSLPETTKLYCAHEYTLANIKFAKSVDGQNEDLLERERKCKALREKNEPTVPTTVGEEKKTNPFCRSGDEKIRKFLGMEEKRDVEVFAQLRTMKDNF
jgi:hydroxyacylglutathione hydrolase